VYFFGVLCRLFDSHCPPDFCVGSLTSQMLLSVSHPWRSSPTTTIGFCWDSYFCCSSRWGSTLSFSSCVSLVTVGKPRIVVFGRHCCCSVVPWCPLVVLLTPLAESFISAPSYSAHVTFFVTPVCWLFLLGRVDFSSSAVASCIWVSLLLSLTRLTFSCCTATLGLWVGLGT
jgi:hypothetical protein